MITTSNHQGLLVVALGPGATPLAGISVSVRGASGSLNSTTDSKGDAIFKNLNAGTYIASMVVNGTYISMPVNFQGNATVTLYAQNMVTTASAELQSGGSVPIEISGNISASQLSGLFLTKANGVYTLSFKITGMNGTVGQATIIIPKSSIPAGFASRVFVNGYPRGNSIKQTVR